MNSHTVDDKYNDNDSKWRGNNNTNREKFSYQSRGNPLRGRNANNHPHRDQAYGYQYSQPQRGSYRRRFGRGSLRGRGYAGKSLWQRPTSLSK